jgi:hypothetical protein
MQLEAVHLAQAINYRAPLQTPDTSLLKFFNSLIYN